MFQNKKIFDHDVAKDVIKKYCTYQDRCQLEVKMRLIKMGLPEPSINEIISVLISEGYLSEERFSRSFSRGKFNIKKWGRLKIKKHLMAKGISNRDKYRQDVQNCTVEVYRSKTIESISGMYSQGRPVRPRSHLNFQIP